MPKADLKTRNRQSAKASRERKKAHLDKLIKQADELTSHNLELASVCEELVRDNRALRKELKELGCPEVDKILSAGTMEETSRPIPPSG